MQVNIFIAIIIFPTKLHSLKMLLYHNNVHSVTETT